MGHRYQRLYDSSVTLESTQQVVLFQKCIDDSQYGHQVKQAKYSLDEERLASLTPEDEEKDCGAKYQDKVDGEFYLKANLESLM